MKPSSPQCQVVQAFTPRHPLPHETNHKLSVKLPSLLDHPTSSTTHNTSSIKISVRQAEPPLLCLQYQPSITGTLQPTHPPNPSYLQSYHFEMPMENCDTPRRLPCQNLISAQLRNTHLLAPIITATPMAYLSSHLLADIKNLPTTKGHDLLPLVVLCVHTLVTHFKV